MHDGQAAQKVWVETVKLTRFRNYASLSLTTDPRHVVLTGENGAGKTNLLEALSLLSPGRGLRRAAYDRLAKVAAASDAPMAKGGDKSADGTPGSDGAAGADGTLGTWATNITVHGTVGAVAIGTGLAPTPSGEMQRRTRINKAPVKSIDSVQDHARVLWLTPAMDGLFTGSSGDRRRFLDRMVLATDPRHGRRVTAYERAMRSRNRLLEDRNADRTWLDGIEAEMASLSVEIAFARRRLTEALSDIIDQGDEDAFPAASLALEGVLEEQASDEAMLDDLGAHVRDLLCRSRPRDSAAGRTLEGPHRTNLAVRHRPKDMDAAVCSTGEQKALLTGLILAHVQLTSKMSGMTPILLLDEIAAHLDGHRRAALFNRLDAMNCQAWMTGTDEHLFEALGDRAQRFTVADGTIARGNP